MTVTELVQKVRELTCDSAEWLKMLHETSGVGARVTDAVVASVVEEVARCYVAPAILDVVKARLPNVLLAVAVRKLTVARLFLIGGATVTRYQVVKGKQAVATELNRSEVMAVVNTYRREGVQMLCSARKVMGGKGLPTFTPILGEEII